MCVCVRACICTCVCGGVHGWVCVCVLACVCVCFCMQIAFEGVAGQDYTGDIAIDDIMLQPGVCPPPGTCNFEYGTCGYFNVQGLEDFDWLRTAGGTITANTGPSVDHTTNSDAGERALIPLTLLCSVWCWWIFFGFRVPVVGFCGCRN